MFRNTIPLSSSRSARFDTTPVADAERHHFDRRLVVVDTYVLVVGVHDGGRAGPEDHRRRFAVEVEEARVRRPLPTADLRLLAGDLRVILADDLNDLVVPRDFRRVRVITDEAHFRRMVLHPRIFRGRVCNVLYEAALDTFVVFARHGRHAAFEHTGRRERTREIAGVERTDHARDRVDQLRIKRMLHGRDALLFQGGDGLCDLVTEFDATDALIAPLDAGRLALNFDLEPDAADARRLHRKTAGLARNAGVSLVAADHRVERTVAANFFVNDDVNVNIPFRLEPRRDHVLDRHDVAGDAALHIARPAPVDAAILDRGRPRIVAPAFAIADRNHVGVAVEQQRAAATGAFPGRDDVGATLIAAIDRDIAGVLLELFPVAFPHVDLEPHLGEIVGEEFLNITFVAGDARDRNHLLKKLDRLLF